MRWLFAVIKRSKGPWSDDTHYGDFLTIGRGSDQANIVPTRVALTRTRNRSSRHTSRVAMSRHPRKHELTYATPSAPARSSRSVSGASICSIRRHFDAEWNQHHRPVTCCGERPGSAVPLETWLANRTPSVCVPLVAVVRIGATMLAHFARLPRRSTRPAAASYQLACWFARLRASFIGKECTSVTTSVRFCATNLFARCPCCNARPHPTRSLPASLGEARLRSLPRDHTGQTGLDTPRPGLCDRPADSQARTRGSTSSPTSRIGSSIRSSSSASGGYAGRRVHTVLASLTMSDIRNRSWPEGSARRPSRSQGLNTPGVIKTRAMANCHHPYSGCDMTPVAYETRARIPSSGFDVLAPDRSGTARQVPEVIYIATVLCAASTEAATPTYRAFPASRASPRPPLLARISRGAGLAPISHAPYSIASLPAVPPESTPSARRLVGSG